MPWTVMDWVALPGGLRRQMTWRNRMSVNSGIFGSGNGPFLPEMEFDDAGLACNQSSIVWMSCSELMPALKIQKFEMA